MDGTWLLGALAALLDITLALFTQSDCPYQPVGAFVGGVCYWRLEELTTFFGARQRCEEQGGALAVIPSTLVLDSLFPETTSTWYYINLYDAYPGGGEEGLPRCWVTSQVAPGTTSILNWRADDQPTGYATNRTDKAVKDCVVVRADEKQLVDKPCAIHVLSGMPQQLPAICSYDPLEPTHACITRGDCLWNHYELVTHAYLESVDQQAQDYGTVPVTSQIHCAVTCHLTPGCHTIRWHPDAGLCHLLGHITLVAQPLTDPDWLLFSRYRFYYDGGNSAGSCPSE